LYFYLVWAFREQRENAHAVEQKTCVSLLLFYYHFVSTAKGVLHGGSDTTRRHKAQITHITQNNIPHSNKTQHKNYISFYTNFSEHFLSDKNLATCTPEAHRRVHQVSVIFV
jgi:hypothetical protein